MTITGGPLERLRRSKSAVRNTLRSLSRGGWSFESRSSNGVPSADRDVMNLDRSTPSRGLAGGLTEGRTSGFTGRIYSLHASCCWDDVIETDTTAGARSSRADDRPRMRWELVGVLVRGQRLGVRDLHACAARIRPNGRLGSRANSGCAPAGGGGLRGNWCGALGVAIPGRSPAGQPHDADACNRGRSRRPHAGCHDCAERDLGERAPRAPMRVEEPRLHRDRQQRLVDLAVDPLWRSPAPSHGASVHQDAVRGPGGPGPPGPSSDLLDGLAEDDETVDADQADGKDAKRPPRVRAADIQQRADRADRGGHDPDQAPIQTAGEKRERGGELDDTQDDRDPPPGVQAREHVLSVVDKEVCISHGGDAVDDVEDARDQQQDPHEQSAAHTSHLSSFCPEQTWLVRNGQTSSTVARVILYALPRNEHNGARPRRAQKPVFVLTRLRSVSCRPPFTLSVASASAMSAPSVVISECPSVCLTSARMILTCSASGGMV